MSEQREGGADRYSRLAEAYDRWGLAPEAETLRELYREAVIQELRGQALGRSHGRSPRPGCRPKV